MHRHVELLSLLPAYKQSSLLQELTASGTICVTGVCIICHAVWDRESKNLWAKACHSCCCGKKRRALLVLWGDISPPAASPHYPFLFLHWWQLQQSCTGPKQGLAAGVLPAAHTGCFGHSAQSLQLFQFTSSSSLFGLCPSPTCKCTRSLPAICSQQLAWCSSEVTRKASVLSTNVAAQSYSIKESSRRAHSKGNFAMGTTVNTLKLFYNSVRQIWNSCSVCYSFPAAMSVFFFTCYKRNWCCCCLQNYPGCTYDF